MFDSAMNYVPICDKSDIKEHRVFGSKVKVLQFAVGLKTRV